MELQQISEALEQIYHQLGQGEQESGMRLLAKLKKDVDDVVHAQYGPRKDLDWKTPLGIIDPDKLEAYLRVRADPIHITIVRNHQYRINGCSFDIEGLDDVANEAALEQFLDHVNGTFSWDDGQDIPDSFFFRAIVGTNPSKVILDAFRKGKVEFHDLLRIYVDSIFPQWDKFVEKTELHDFGTIDEQEDATS